MLKRRSGDRPDCGLSGPVMGPAGLAPEPTFAISIEGRLESARHGYSGLASLLADPAAPGRAFLPEWAIPLSYRQLWMTLSLMGTQSRR